MIAELLNISIPGAIVAIAVLTIVFGIITVNVLCKKQKERRRAEELVEDEGEIREPRQVTMKITCDEGFSAEFLRELDGSAHQARGRDNARHYYVYPHG